MATATKTKAKTKAKTKTKTTVPKTIYDEFLIRTDPQTSKNTVAASGDFSYTRDFQITDINGNDLKYVPNVNGYIFQKITKTVDVVVPDPAVGKPARLTTSDHVMDYTNGIVNSMSESYVEAFVVTKGIVRSADKFSNASILRYKGKKGQFDPAAPNTKGKITQIGEYYFIPSTNTTIPTITAELASLGITIKHKGITNPANGLPCSTDLTLFDRFEPMRKSPIYMFELTITWDDNEDDSIITPSERIIALGGKRIMSRKNKNKKRKTRKNKNK